MLKQFMEMISYNCEVVREFKRNEREYLIAKQFSPNGEYQGKYAIYRDGNKIFNNKNKLLATINNGKFELI